LRAEIVSIGDEMTTGQRLDTNSQWLSQQLADLGVTTVRHTTVADDLAANIDVFRGAAQRAEIVISTGGLGPTRDDLTREALAAAFNRPLELHEPSLAHIERLFSRRQRPMPENNRQQAYLPGGSQAIHNPHGTAPGIGLVVHPAQAVNSAAIPPPAASHLFALPGVPAEMREMYFQSVAPRIVELLGPERRPLWFHTVKLFGIGESDVEARLPDLIRRDRVPRVGITVSQATISLRIVAEARTQDEFQRLIAPTVTEIQTALGTLIFGSDETEIQDALTRLLRSLSLRIACLEIGGDCVLGPLLSDAEDAGDTVAGVLSFPSLAQAAETLLRVGGGLPELPAAPPADAGQETLFAWLALVTQHMFAADLGLAFGPYPDHPSDGRSPGADVCFALAGEAITPEVHTRFLGGHPDVVNSRIAKTAIDFARLKLLDVNQPL
jgi:nicotinamide-nucleotide amidase